MAMGWMRAGVWGLCLAIAGCDPAADDGPRLPEVDAVQGGAPGCEGVALPDGIALESWGGAALDLEDGRMELMFSEEYDHETLCVEMSAEACVDGFYVPRNLTVTMDAIATSETVVDARATWFEGDCEMGGIDDGASSTTVEVTAVTDTCIAGRVEMVEAPHAATGEQFVFAIPRC